MQPWRRTSHPTRITASVKVSMRAWECIPVSALPLTNPMQHQSVSSANQNAASQSSSLDRRFGPLLWLKKLSTMKKVDTGRVYC